MAWLLGLFELLLRVTVILSKVILMYVVVGLDVNAFAMLLFCGGNEIAATWYKKPPRIHFNLQGFYMAVEIA